ncbi:unnamed protein product [Pedinophyceae sp. YPF-701]|nr:unnamed protein product [Pedinophyceae sp. YPF-701]
MPDPESKFRTYGSDFGGGFKLMPQWMQQAPRVRRRTPSDRSRDQLVDLAVLNARLEGQDSVAVRKRLEHLKMRRENWEEVHRHVMRHDAEATLASIEEVARAVAALPAEQEEGLSIAALSDEVKEAQEMLADARRQLNITQKRVEANQHRVRELKLEAERLESLRVDAASAGAQPEAAAAAPSPREERSGAERPRPAPTRARRSDETRGAGRRRTKRRGPNLHSSLEPEDALKEFWHPVEFASQLPPNKMVPVELFGDAWVLFRDENGDAACIKDECAHRACPLSLGQLVDGQPECPYHGWTYSRCGEVTKMPSTRFCHGLRVRSLPVVEKDGFVWVWPGQRDPTPLPERTAIAVPEGYECHAEISLEVPVEHGLLVENLLDLAHAPFTHTATFAKGWTVPDMVRIRTMEMLAGEWHPYPINMSFEPPCMTLSTVGLHSPGSIERGVTADAASHHLHQLHVCVPASGGKTRVLYRMSMDFLGWLRQVPLVDRVWEDVARQVLEEDLRLVAGQQDRMQRSGDLSITWANPVSYDKLAVRYRRWRNGVVDAAANGDEPVCSESVECDAGTLFRLDEEEGESSDDDFDFNSPRI